MVSVAELKITKVKVMNTEFKSRKHPRLKNYDYNISGAYFITICTKDRKHILGSIVNAEGIVVKSSGIVGRVDPGAPNIKLSQYGQIVSKCIADINFCYESRVTVDKYIVMPNHIHLIVSINGGAPGSTRPTSTAIPNVISAFKKITNKQCELKLWQSSYYDHIIRSEKDYQEIWKYIDENPIKWELDKYYKQLD